MFDTLELESAAGLGEYMHAFVSELYPICRSITGEGVRKTLRRIAKDLPLSVTEVPTGTEVFDWTVPREWNVRDAYVKDASGARVIDFQAHNLHLVNYSSPFSGRLSLPGLRPHLHSLPDRPDSIPYRTTYYREAWGFCLADRQLQSLPEGEYEVLVDSSLTEGSLTYGECLVRGQSEEEVLVSCHVCHPSMCNDNLSGIATAVFLARHLLQAKPRFSYRFLFIPGTIGSIAWLSRNRDAVERIRHGLVLTCVGNDAPFTFKRTRRDNAPIDRAFAHVLRHVDPPGKLEPFSPYGYDERQFCSPGFNLPVGCLMRSVHGTFPEYHTSADNLDFVRPARLAETVRTCLQAFDVLENDEHYWNLKPFCEPQLGKRGLYVSTGAGSPAPETMAMLWVLNLSDGSAGLLDIAERAGLPFPVIARAACCLERTGLLGRAVPEVP